MQTASNEYKKAIVGSHRRIIPVSYIDLTDPDILYGPVASNGETPYSDPLQIYNKKMEAEGPIYATCEHNRFILDGSITLLPDNPMEMTGEHGYLINIMSKQDGTFDIPPYVELKLENLSILQAASIYFTGRYCDGHGVNFLFEIYSGDTIVFSKSVVNNQEIAVFFDGFTVNNVTAIRATITKWSLPMRYPRIAEIVPGIYEKWDGSTIYSIDVLQETAFDCLTVPYGTCMMEVHNENKRFNPFSKSGLFQSIEERQGIPLSYGVGLPNGMTEKIPLGVYYQQNGGWETDAYGQTIKFKLVDLVGLLATRSFVLPDPMPTTLAGWIEAIVAHLGDSFRTSYKVDANIVNTILTADGESMKNTTCGQVLRYACMASSAFFRAEPTDGNLMIASLPILGGITMQLQNMYSYPQNQAGESVAQITFRLADTEKTEYVVNGTLGASDKSLSISNPFIHTKEQADMVATHILKFYGTTKFTIKGRGDMRCELGDIDSFETGFGGTAEGRRYKQQFKIENGIMKTAPSYLLEL